MSLFSLRPCPRSCCLARRIERCVARLPFPPHAPLMAENKIAVVVFALVMIGIIGVVIYYLTKPKDAPK